MSFFNAIVGFILRSPLHPILSGSTMLITVTGRKSGRRYTVPVNYVRDGDEVIVTSRRGRRWWRNLEGGAPVSLRIQGKDLDARAEPVADDEKAIVEGLRAFYQRIRPSRASAERLAEAARDRIVVRIDLA